MRQRLRAMIRKEFLQAFRDPRMRSMLFLPPLIQLLIFGYAANLDVNTAKIAWMDQDHSPESRELYSQFLGVRPVHHRVDAESEKQMQDDMDRGRVDGVIRVLPGFARDIERGRPTSVQVLLDGTNSNAASIVSGYAGQTIARFTSDVMADRQRQKLVAAGVPVHPAIPQVFTEARVWLIRSSRAAIISFPA